MLILTLLEKHATEIGAYLFDFSLEPEIVGGDTLFGTPTVSATPIGLTLGSPSIVASFTKVLVLISGGVLGTAYVVRVTVETLDGFTLVGEGRLLIV